MNILTGEQFNKTYKNRKFVKLTNLFENHNGYQFQTGLNIDSIPFNPSSYCQSGGIYFCEFEKLPIWLQYGSKLMYYARAVSIPNSAQVYREWNKWKADRLILGEREKIGELEIWNDQKYCALAFEQNRNMLKYLQTNCLCLAAVQTDPYIIKDVRNQTSDLCLEAVKGNWGALKYVKVQTPEICIEAVRQNGLALQYVSVQTIEICIEAVRQNGLALQYVNVQTIEICMEAVRQNGLALQYVKSQTDLICWEAFQQNGQAIIHVRF